MAYTSKEEVAADFKDMSFTSSSNISINDVNGFILEADALINSYLSTVYTTPVVTGSGLTLLKLLSRSLVADRIKKILEVKQEKSGDANQIVRTSHLDPKAVMKILSDLQNGNMNLEGAEVLNSELGFASGNVKNSVAPVIEKSTKQW